MMKSNFKATAIGFAAGLAIAAVAAQATQHDQHAQHAPATATQGQPAPGAAMGQGQHMMGDPAMHQQMMERMRQCRDTMTHMIDHMGQMHDQHSRP